MGGAGGGGIGLEGVLLAWVVLPFSGGTERAVRNVQGKMKISKTELARVDTTSTLE